MLDPGLSPMVFIFAFKGNARLLPGVFVPPGDGAGINYPGWSP